MKLTDLMTGLMAKAAARFGKHTGAGLFGEFEQRKEHLHQEARVDKRGQVQQRWVKNKQKGEAVPAMPSLFDQPKAPPAPKPAPAAPLFDFNFSAPKESASGTDFKALAAATRAKLPAQHGRKADDGSLSMTQEEYRAQQAGVLLVGSTKQEGGRTYKLNGNHRWERVEDAAPPPTEAVSYADFYANRSRYGFDESGQPVEYHHGPDGAVHESRVNIKDPLPSGIRTGVGDLSVRPSGEVDGLAGAWVRRSDQGDHYLHLSERAAPIHLTTQDGLLRVTKPEELGLLTPERTHNALVAAIQDVQHTPTPEATQVLRSAIKNDQLVRGQADSDTSHVPAAPQDTPPAKGQRYLVGLPEGVTDAERRRMNLAAEALIAEVQHAPRTLNEAERQLIARYSGNGGIGASLNEYYTPPELGEAMWDVLRSLGSGKGAGLEPSSGPGVLAQFAGPDAKLDMVELSPTSAGIANALFGHRHDVHSMSFEAFGERNPDKKYDFMIGNPPFGYRDESKFLTDKYQDISECSRFFTLSSLDALKEGGIATFVLPAGLARNKTDDDFRARVLARAEVLAIHGLPTDTFERAGTETATTDVWVLRGRPEAVRGILDAAGEQGLKAAGIHDAAFLAGKWHEAHPEQMHGAVTQRSGPRGAKIYARDGALGQDVLSALTRTTPNPPAPTLPSAEELLDKLKGNSRAVAGWLKAQRGKEGETRVTEAGTVQICLNGRWHNVSQDTPKAHLAASQLGDLISLHGTVLNHGQFQEANELRASIERLVKEWVATYGNPHEHAELRRISAGSAALNNLLAAISPSGELTPHFQTDAAPPEDHYDDNDAASVHAYLRRSGKPTSTENMRLYLNHATPEAAAQRLAAEGYAYHPERGIWQHAGEFYSGDSNDLHALIDRGLDDPNQPQWAREALTRQREDLQRRVPEVPLTEFDVTPRDSWVPKDALAEYLYDAYVSKHKKNSYYIYGDTVKDWIEDGPNGTRTVKKSSHQSSNFLRRYLTGVGARSDEASLYQELDEEFRDWLAENPRHREAVEAAYAARGAWLEPQWSVDPVDAQIPGWLGKDEGGVTLHAYQNEAIHRSLAQGGGIFALDVGLGKTPTAIAQALYAKHLGLCRRPVAAVPKSVIGQWRQKARQVKPDAKILVVGAEPQLDAAGQVMLDEEGREIWNEVTGAAALDAQLSRAKGQDYDLILLTHTTLGRIQFDSMQQVALIEQEFYDQRQEQYGKPSGMSAKLYQEYAGLKAQAMIDAGELTLADLETAGDKLKELELDLKEAYSGKKNLTDNQKKDKKRKQEERDRLRFLLAADRSLNKDTGHPLKTKWDELGFDHLIVDEAHEFKGLWTYSKSRGDKAIKYLGAPNEPSQRAIDLYFKTRAMREANGGRGVYLLTATPIKNSPVELYNMLSYTAPQLFKRLGIHNLDHFVQRYCRIEEQMVMDEETGELHSQSVMVGLKNLSELRREAGRYVNRKTAEQVGLKLPFNDREVIHVDPRTEQADFIKYVALNPVEAARDYLGATVPDGLEAGTSEYEKFAQRYALAMPHLTRRAELDMEMIDHEQHKGYVSPKVEHLLTDLKGIAERGEKCVIFSDVVNMPGRRGGKPNPNGYSFHDKLKRLIHEQTGVPLDEIAIVNAQTCPNSEDRLAISNGVKSGKYRFVIGNTGTMGQGINLQHGVANLRNLDVPWNPAVDQQRQGRVVRQGNKSAAVSNRTFLGTRGLDKDMYDILQGKGVWYNEFWNGVSDTMDTDGQADYRATPERLALLALDDPAKREQALAALNAKEAQGREVGRRMGAVKQFSRLQGALQALNYAKKSLGWSEKDSADVRAKKQASVDALQQSVDKMTEKLRAMPAFAPFLSALDHPAISYLDAATGKIYKQGQQLMIRGADGELPVVVTGGNTRQGQLEYANLGFHGGAMGVRANWRTTKLADFAQAEQREYDPHAHLADYVAGGHFREEHREVFNQNRAKALIEAHGSAITEGLRRRDASKGKHLDDEYRVVKRDGQVQTIPAMEARSDEHYLTPSHPDDLAAARHYAENLVDHEQRHRAKYALMQQQFDVGYRYGYGGSLMVKGVVDTSLSAIYAGLKGGN